MGRAETPGGRLARWNELIDTKVVRGLKSHGAYKAFQKLEKGGVPRTTLIGSLNVLSVLSSGELSYLALTGFAARKFKTVPPTLKRAAALLKELASAGRFDLLEPCFPPILDSTYEGQLLIVAGFLETAAARLEKQVPELVGQREDESAIAMLVAEVIHHTGKPHDEELSTIINAMTGDLPTPEAMRMWRLRHRRLIRLMQKRLASLIPDRQL